MLKNNFFGGGGERKNLGISDVLGLKWNTSRKFYLSLETKKNEIKQN